MVSGNKSIQRPWSGVCLLGIILAFYVLFQIVEPHPFHLTGPLLFWLGVAGFWLIPVRLVPLYLLAAGLFFGVIAVAVITNPHPKAATFPTEIGLSCLACIALLGGALRSYLLLRKNKLEQI